MSVLQTRTDKRINTENIKSKSGHDNFWFTQERELKSVHKINPNLRVCSADKGKPKRIHKMDIIVNTSKLKDKKDEEPAVTDIEVIKAPGYF